METPDYLVKLVIVGDSGVGKSSIVQRYGNNSFKKDFLSTIGVDFEIKNIDIDSSLVRLQLWDTSGDQNYRALIQSYYACAHAFVIVYDCTDPSSFENVRRIWLPEIRARGKRSTYQIISFNNMQQFN